MLDTKDNSTQNGLNLKAPLHTEALAHGSHYTQGLIHTEAFTNTFFYVEVSILRSIFTEQFLTRRN